GWIDYKGWAKNPDEIVFRKDSLSPDGSKFGVKDISYFEIFDKDIYVRASLTLDMRPVEIPEVWPEEADSTLYDTLFLRVLVKGTPLNLYELVHDKTHYFVRK